MRYDTVDYASSEFFVNVAVFNENMFITKSWWCDHSPHCCDSQTVANGFIGNSAVTFEGG